MEANAGGNSGGFRKEKPPGFTDEPGRQEMAVSEVVYSCGKSSAESSVSISSAASSTTAEAAGR